MERVTTRAGLVAMLENLLSVEKGARDRYEEDVSLFKNPEFKATLASIKKDEDRHILMIEKLLGMLGKREN